MSPPARLLDLSRLVSRAARTLTGVDRVERAYLDAFLADGVPAWGLVRTSVGYLLLDRTGMTALSIALSDQSWDKPRLIDTLLRRRDPARAGVERHLRNRAVARATRRGLARILRRHLPPGTSYVNVGQTSLSTETLSAVRQLSGVRVAVMIHDTIPLDHPEWQRPGSAEGLARRLALVAKQADVVIANSYVVAADIRRHLPVSDRAPDIVTAHLGVDLSAPVAGDLPGGLDLSRPYFVTVSTIEPRKNHALLLDVWEMLGADPPPLYIVGGRGWMNDDVFRRLDARPPGIVELTGLSDGAVAALVASARASLNPTLAEGFGLPALEAAARGVPVVCGDLAIWREMLGTSPVYVDLRDRYLWAKTVEALAQFPVESKPVEVPGWPGHFKTVLNAV